MNNTGAASKGHNQKTAVTPTRDENFPEWYQQVVRVAEMAENSAVRGCYIIKPYGYAIWENVQKHFDAMIKEEEVQNAYFPLLIPLSYIAKEADHVDGFAKECAVVTHHRLAKNNEGVLAPDPDSELTEPFIIRPTSETIIGESMHNWVQSYRDLPLKLNQWCNVMRWEMRPRIFLRTAEFLWQEGHNAFAAAEEADLDARKMLDCYQRFLENYMAIPGFAGMKTADERFPGAIETYTIEAFMQDGKALQACTSHNLGQTFAKSSDIQYLDKDGIKKHAWTTSWGLSTRTIGGLIMTHADDDGMVMPPFIAPYQIVILPFINKDDDVQKIYGACEQLKRDLKAAGLSVYVDTSDARSSDKMWAAIKKGVPLRLELGGREIEEGNITYTRRDLGRASKTTLKKEQFIQDAAVILKKMHNDMLEAARSRMHAFIHPISSLEEMRHFFASDKPGGVKIDYALLQKHDDEFQKMRKEFSVTPRCLPLADDGRTVIVARSY
jgi:prolyl-tRNA synthetase